MSGLLRADLRRVLKDKLLIVVGILAVVFAVAIPLLYAFMLSGTDSAENDMVTEMLSDFIYGKTQFFGSFSIGNNLGLIAPILLAIVLCKDFSFGTIRNKIIAGKSRSTIFMSLFITCSIVLVAVMLLHAFLTLGVSLIFFKYQPTAFTFADFGYFMASLAFEILFLIFISSLISCLCASMKNVGLVIVLYIAITFALTLIAGIIQIVIAFLESIGDQENTVAILRFFDRINVGNYASYIGQGTEYTLKDVLYLTLPSIVGILGFVSLGLLKFNKKDLK